MHRTYSFTEEETQVGVMVISKILIMPPSIFAPNTQSILALFADNVAWLGRDDSLVRAQMAGDGEEVRACGTCCEVDGAGARLRLGLRLGVGDSDSAVNQDAKGFSRLVAVFIVPIAGLLGQVGAG